MNDECDIEWCRKKKKVAYMHTFSLHIDKLINGFFWPCSF